MEYIETRGKLDNEEIPWKTKRDHSFRLHGMGEHMHRKLLGVHKTQGYGQKY